jgi:hypothetical protein
VRQSRPDIKPELDFALNTGLRLSEMDDLTRETVSLARRIPTIPRSKNGETWHVPCSIVQELLGHKSVAMTVPYSHLSPSHTLAAVERLTDAAMEIATGTKIDTSFEQPSRPTGCARLCPVSP